MHFFLAEKMISQYLDGSLDKKNKARLETHFQKCQRCRQKLEALKQANELVLKLRETSAPPAEYWETYWSRLNRRLPPAAEDRPRPFFFPLPRLSWEGALALLLLLSLSFLLKNITFSRLPGKTTAKSVYREVKLFREVREMFPRNIKWILVNNGRIALGLSPASRTTPVSAEKTIIFDFTLLRDGSAATGHVVSSPHIIAFNGEEAKIEFYDDLNKKTVLYRYRVLPTIVGEDKISARLEFELIPCWPDKEMKTGAYIIRRTVYMRENVSRRLARFHDPGGDYQIYLTAHFGKKYFAYQGTWKNAF